MSWQKPSNVRADLAPHVPGTEVQEALKHREAERPSYFNTGCCSFGDGDVTGLEFAGGRVKLVRWRDNEGTAASPELASEDLRTMFGQLTGSAPAPSQR